MYNLTLGIVTASSIAMVIAIMMQLSKQNSAASAFTGGADQLFGKQKAHGFEVVMQRSTAVMGAVWMILSSVPILLSPKQPNKSLVQRRAAFSIAKGTSRKKLWKKLWQNEAKEVKRVKQLPKSSYAKHGKRAALLLHTCSGSPNDTRMPARFLEKVDYTVHASLFKGHGTMEPYDTLQEKAEIRQADTKKAIRFLQPEQFPGITALGLSMGGIFAVWALEEESIIGGGSFCSPLPPVKTNAPENFEKHVHQMLKMAGKFEKEINGKAVSYRLPAEHQSVDIQDQVVTTESRLLDIQQSIFLAQARKDEMIDPNGVFGTAHKLSRQQVTLQWYPESGHTITAGTAGCELEKDVSEPLEKLPWNEE